MNEKITAVNISDALATQLTFPKKVADLFMHAFCDTILEGLDSDGIVKVKGLGTFRIVNVESRESVSVTTGERIVIPSFRKLSFTPEDSVTDRISGITPEPTQPTETPNDVPPVEEFFAAIKASEEPEIQEPSEPLEPTGPVEEIPTDEFSGIDVLIATPESLEELHDRLAEAREQQVEADNAVVFAQNRLDEAKAQAQQAEEGVAVAQQRAELQRAEVERIQQLIENVETNRLTQLAAVETPEPEDIPETPGPPVVDETPETPEPPQPIISEETPQPPSTPHEKRYKAPWWRIPLILLILLLVGAICYFVAFNPKLPLKWLNLDKQEVTEQPKTQQPEQPKPAVKPGPKDTIVVEHVTKPDEKPAKPEPKTATTPEPKPEAEKPKQEKPAEPTRPKTHTVRRGESLTKISMLYYGTKDSVRAIIRANNFKDPNNINEGAVVKLP